MMSWYLARLPQPHSRSLTAFKKIPSHCKTSLVCKSVFTLGMLWGTVKIGAVKGVSLDLQDTTENLFVIMPDWQCHYRISPRSPCELVPRMSNSFRGSQGIIIQITQHYKSWLWQIIFPSNICFRSWSWSCTQPEGCEWTWLHYYSKKLLPRKSRYSMVEKECLAITLAMETFRVYLELSSISGMAQQATRKECQINSLKLRTARLHFEVVHWAGTANGNADALSRVILVEAKDK